ncbi:hypothetical protein PBI_MALAGASYROSE_48 [Mycobacterium phage MalagasyRose]|uniref:Uncharacterized protein n=1 Tax=Mycobacterium phage MalagasyRose TaxID=2599870 RepID=A0A5J6TDI8_9CAUD|nr:hypothetical protein QEH39_gp40 [Mycobacterium phage MalagasyRose]QFG08896.1 hypothetical protein PBI_MALAGASYROSE_48 [Mycobacterium phage MalagasyRose]
MSHLMLPDSDTLTFAQKVEIALDRTGYYSPQRARERSLAGALFAAGVEVALTAEHVAELLVARPLAAVLRGVR